MSNSLRVVGDTVKSRVALHTSPDLCARRSGSGWTPSLPGLGPTLQGALTPARHGPHLRNPRRDILHRFETPGPQQDSLVELRRLVLGGDPMDLPGCEGDRDIQRDGETDGPVIGERSRLHPPASAFHGPVPPGSFPAPAHQNLGAPSLRGSRHWSIGGDPGARETRPAAARLLGALPGRSRGCALGGGAGGSRRWPACC